VSAEGRAALLAPARVAGLALANRIVMAPMSRYFCPDGIPGPEVAAYYRRRAEGGVGLIISEGTYIPHPSAASYDGVPWFGGGALAGWAGVLAAVHAAGGRMFPQLWHTGSFRRSGMAPDPALPGLGPSANRNPAAGHDEASRAMTEAEIAEVIAAYARAAADARRLGFDGVEIHGAHGYLLDEFLWAATNRRSDRWGGDIAARTRLAAAVVVAIRAATGPDFPISFRFSLWKQQDYTARLAATPAELDTLLAPIVAAGASLLHVSTRRLWEPGFPGDGPRTLAGWTKALTGLPVVAVGGAGLDRPGLKGAAAAPIDHILDLLLAGEFDLLAVGRALLADAGWPDRLARGTEAAGRGYDRAMLAALD